MLAQREYPYVGLAFVLQDDQGTLLVALRLHADFLLCMRTDGCRGVYTVDSRGQKSSGHAAFFPLLLAVSQTDNSLSKKRQYFRLPSPTGWPGKYPFLAQRVMVFSSRPRKSAAPWGVIG